MPSSPPPQTPRTTLDESRTTPLKSPLAHLVRPQPDSPSSSSQLSALPTLSDASSRHRTVSASTSMPAIQSKVHPSSPPQNLTTSSISFNSNNTSCLILPAHAAASQYDSPLKLTSQPPSSGIVDPASLSTKSRHSITPSFSFPGAISSATNHECTAQQTPNVYINGLPPHYSEQDLFALARPFGNIKSVRTFTRHVSEKPTGYGFVLFSDVESAQRCIDWLRKDRNLHPSFSKQVHRIPGTEYAQHCASQSNDQDEDSFKSRMEKLKDVSSTNLYIEGLPLSIDEESLTALVLPHRIKSSRFFKTKLSHPPRIIAFVRLETRGAAEETIERLHGRMVRGWNDPGCRISVRFADSAEQRELRRAERTLKNGDQSPSRLTIAQASLLNLRGQELQANVIASKPRRFPSSCQDNQAASNPSPGCSSLPTSRSLPSKLPHTFRESPLVATSDLQITSEMDTLLRSIRNGYDDGSLDNTMRSLAADNDHLVTQQAQLRALANATLLSPNPFPLALPRGHAQARNGFTPAEELIFEAHAQRLQLQAQISRTLPIPQPISNANIHSFASASHEPPLQASGLAGKGYQDTLPTISEDEFHAMSHPAHTFVPTANEYQVPGDSCPPSASATRDTIFVRPPSRAISIVPPPPDYEEPGNRPKGHNQRAERTLGTKQTPCPSSSFSNRHPTPPSNIKHHPSLLRASTRPNNVNNSSSANNTSTIPRDEHNEQQLTYMYSHGDTQSCPGEDKGLRFRSSKLGDQHSSVKEELKSPSAISPALTYSSRTPSTLSPVTPFFGSFTGSQDAFEHMTMNNEGMGERKLRTRVANQ